MLATRTDCVIATPISVDADLDKLQCPVCQQRWSALRAPGTGELVVTWWMCPHRCNLKPEAFPIFREIAQLLAAWRTRQTED